MFDKTSFLQVVMHNIEHHPIPTVEETIQELSGGKVFSKLDLNMAYHQVGSKKGMRPCEAFMAPHTGPPMVAPKCTLPTTNRLCRGHSFCDTKCHKFGR